MGWKNIIQGYKVIGESEVTKTFYVDANRTDDYIENGCIVRPFKTIQAAIAVANNHTVIRVAPGTYSGDITLNKPSLSLIGSGIENTILTGNLTAGSSIEQTLRDFKINPTGSLTIVSGASATNLRLYCPVIVSGTYSFNCDRVIISPVSGNVPLTISTTGTCSLHRGWIEAVGDISAIIQTNGTLSISHLTIENNSAGNSTINSTGGVSHLRDSIVINNGGGSAIILDNDGSSSVPNALNLIVAAGNIDCLAIPTYIEALNFIIFGALSGSALIYKPASRINNDSSVTGATVKDALEALDTRITALEP